MLKKAGAHCGWRLTVAQNNGIVELAAAATVQIARTCAFARILAAKLFFRAISRLCIVIPVTFVALALDFALKARAGS